MVTLESRQLVIRTGVATACVFSTKEESRFMDTAIGRVPAVLESEKEPENVYCPHVPLHLYRSAFLKSETTETTELHTPPKGL